MSMAAPTATPSGSRVGRLSVFSRAEGGVLGVQAAGPLLLGHQQGVGPSPSVSQGPLWLPRCERRNIPWRGSGLPD